MQQDTRVLNINFKNIPKKTSDKTKIVPHKEKIKRVITNTNKWNFGEPELTPENQLQYIKQIHDNAITDNYKKHCKMVLQQMNLKINGYKHQDQIKNRYSETEFIDIGSVLTSLKECQNRCFYCKDSIQVLYEYVREPKQWSLERINNNLGHNKTNVVIACLNCNLHRRTMYHERYLFTKQLIITKETSNN